MMVGLVSFGQVASVRNYNITNAGATIILDPTLDEIPDLIMVSAATPVTLLADYEINASSVPSVGTRWRVFFDLTDVTLNGHSVVFFGYTVLPSMMLTMGYYDFFIYEPTLVGYCYAPYDFNEGNLVLNGAIIQAGTIPLSALDGTIPLSALDTLGRGRIIYGAAANVMSSQFAGGSGKILIGDGTDVKSLSVTGDVTISGSAVTTLDSVVVDADIKTGAAIKRQKLAAGTASAVVINSGAGYMTDEATLNPLRGGLGADVSGSTGFVTFSSGSSTVGSILEVRDLHASFASSSQGTYYITFPVSVTVNSVEVRVETALAATDSATILIQNDASTNMTGDNLSSGLLVLAASSTTGTGYTSTLLSNNTFTAGQRMRLTTNKGTAGGTVNIQVNYSRVN